MRAMPPFNEWVIRAVFLVGGYVLRWWLVDSGQAQWASDSINAPRYRRTMSARATEELKLVLVVNDDLKMGKGKIGAQCAHAAVGIVDELHEQGCGSLLLQWEEAGQPKICLRARDNIELRELRKAARAANLPTFQVADAGRTQVAAGSHTVLAIGPAPKSAIDRITGHLRLL